MIKTRLAFYCCRQIPELINLWRGKALLGLMFWRPPGRLCESCCFCFCSSVAITDFSLQSGMKPEEEDPPAPQCILRALSQRSEDTRAQLLIVLLLPNTRKLGPRLLKTKVCEFLTSPTMENCKDSIWDLSQQYTRFPRIRSDRVSGNCIPGTIFTLC